MEARTNQHTEDICFTPATELREMILKKIISPVELVETFLERIEAINPVINAYCTVVPELALQTAREAESDIINNREVGLLTGIPVSIKDVTMTAGVRTTYGSKLYENFIPSEDELVVERIKKAGGIILGKTNTPEFAAGGSTFNKVFGVTRNPWNIEFNAGGSSGGAAAAVAAGIGPLAQGNDLGGSVRLPASFCGVVGLRPSPGRIPWYPNDLNWDDLIVQGPIARTVSDIALMLDVISGPDKRTPVALPKEKIPFLKAIKREGEKNLRIAWSDNLNLMPVDQEVLKAARNAIDVFRRLGCEVVENCPDFSNVRETALILRGLWFVAKYQNQLADPQFKRWVNPLVINNIEEGLRFSVLDVAKAYRWRSEIWDRVRSFFERYDFLVTPTAPIPPFPAEIRYPTEIGGKPMDSYIDWVMLTYAITIAGLPAVSVPCGWTEKGLPIGVQIIGRRHSESSLLQIAAAYERVVPWANKRPSLR